MLPTPPRQRLLLLELSVVALIGFSPLDLRREGKKMRGILHTCISNVLHGTLPCREKATFSKFSIIIRVCHDVSQLPTDN
jgi:hypothetical protein